MESIQSNIMFDNLSVKSEKPVSDFLAVAKKTPYSVPPQAYTEMRTPTVQQNDGATNHRTYPPTQTVPVNGANGVNIVIYNPSVQPPNGTSNITNNNYNQSYPKEYYTQTYTPTQAPLATANIAQQAPSQTVIQAPAPQPVAAAPAKPQKTKEIVQLTDNYVKTLEGYVKNPDSAEIRLMGSVELQERFKEDTSRRNDSALNSLLNVCLQDKDPKVRFRALTTLDNNWASGNQLTMQILNNMRTSKAVYGDDAYLASNVLLKLAGTKVKVPDTSTSEAKQK